MIRMRGTSLLRPAGFDELGLRRAISDRLLPFLVAAMAFLAALALTGWVGAAALANSWHAGVASTLTVQVPQPGDPAAQGGGTRVARVLATLRAAPDVAEARALTEDELANLLRPWLGAGADRLAIPLPAVIAVRLADSAGDIEALARQLEALAPGTLTERHAGWMRRLSVLARSLQACAGLILLLVAAVAVTVVAVATRAGLAARREAIEIVHGLGATDFYIAGRFAVRATMLAAVGGGVGAVVALPVLLVLANLAAPLTGSVPHISLPAGRPAGLPPGLPAGLAAGLPIDLLTALPALVWLALPVLPLLAAAIGCITAQITVRRWLRRLP
jgi:cell division transport system permease protein